MKYVFINILVVIGLILLPYVLFQGKYYIGGDDTRLLYLFPKEFLFNYGLYSWLNYSSTGVNAPWQFLAPFLSVWSLLGDIINNKIILGYLAFSSPLIISFIYLQKLLNILVKGTKYKVESVICSLFFILSPILAINQLFLFLSTVWLIGLIPILIYYYLSYLKYARLIDLLKGIFWSIFLSLAFFSIPWIIGVVLPFAVAVIIIIPFMNFKDLWVKIKRSFVFAFFIFLSQQFWFLPFISTYFYRDVSNFGTKILSDKYLDTFTPTVQATATGNIFYPLLNLFHRQITVDYNWQLYRVFLEFYDKFIFINLIFILIILIGIYSYRKKKVYVDKTYLLLLISFVISLALFTVNIGPFKEIFIEIGVRIPGFVMFRNFYDKFALGYVFIYSLLLFNSLIFIKPSVNRKLYNCTLTLLLIIILFNFIPIKKIVNAPLWQTDNIARNMTFPEEYLSFLNDIKNVVSPTSNVMSIPLTNSVYSVIPEDSSSNTYVGASPLKIFTGINDFPGNMSFSYGNYDLAIDELIIGKNYKEISDYFYRYNINYILLTKNISPQVLNASWLYRQEILKATDRTFIDQVGDKKILTSNKGNYELYAVKKPNIAISAKNIYYAKINAVRYKIYIKNLKKDTLLFNDTYHSGWDLYLKNNPTSGWCKNKIYKAGGASECIFKSEESSKDYLSLFMEKPFENNMEVYEDFGNSWKLDADIIKQNFDKSFYKLNPDGTIDIELELYFTHQNFFIYGLFISFISLVILVLRYVYEKKSN